MNLNNLNILFQHYIEQFEWLNEPVENNEKYKWDAIGQVQKCWDLGAENLADMIRRSFSLSENLVNNRIVYPETGLVEIARAEPEEVRSALAALLEDTDDVNRKQDQILTFEATVNALLDRHFPGKWKYEQNVRSAICYLSMIKPAQNYMFKSSPAHEFAHYMEFDDEIGKGQSFKLRSYYTMCDQLVEQIKACPELLKTDASRDCEWKDPSYHVLAYDLIYCFKEYNLNGGMHSPKLKSKTSSGKPAVNQAQLIDELQAEIEQLQDQIDDLQNQIKALPQVQFEGMTMNSKAFGPVVISRQEEQYLFFEVDGEEKSFALPGCISNGFLIPESADVKERYDTEAALSKQISMLESQQKTLNRKLNKLQL